MLVTQKCQYALRALLELAKQDGRGPIKIAVIAEEQGISLRFLEVILSQLKQGGFVESRRGTEGGYLLARKPSDINVWDVVEFIDGPVWQPEEPASAEHGEDVFAQVWHQAAACLRETLGRFSIADLKYREETMRTRFVPNYQI